VSNSSGSLERFLLGPSESKTFEVLAPGGLNIGLDVQNGIGQGVDGLMASGDNASAVILLETGNDVPAQPATLVTALAGANNDLRFQARTPGVAGNSITIEYVDPLGNNQPLGVTVLASAITVSLATGPAGAITSTATLVAAAIAALPAADALVWVRNADSNDGSGVVTALAATPLTGGAAAAPLTFSTVATLTVVPGGKGVTGGICGRYCRIRNTGTGIASVIAKPLHRLQPLTFL